MKDNHNSPKPEPQNFNMENQAAQLAVIAGLITTLGDDLSTVAAALALQEAQQSNQNNIMNSNSDLHTMQNRLMIYLEK
ncbi:hypothetical protein J2Y03_005822 [Neobacillus niacini]|uniref:multidrug ABC transporter ATPase n=1 Tax=Neobacillus niacini TaxID=86668 RepID=UPI00285D7FBA|nr:multidrug ABC transporter ATPase [Neobacillus niacini]MDR7080724.1 hypothetical protein [Neobacillus niacini]